MYCFFRDFAGPIATVIASVTAAFFIRRQWLTAVKQANIAEDQLRYNLFEKRYAIYAAAKEAINIAFAKCGEAKMPEELEALLLTFEESRFFFSENIHSFLDQLRKDIKIFLNENNHHRNYMAQNSENTTLTIRAEILKQKTDLLTLQEGLYATQQMLPQRFSSELTFPQLTGKGERHHV